MSNWWTHIWLSSLNWGYVLISQAESALRKVSSSSEFIYRVCPMCWLRWAWDILLLMIRSLDLIPEELMADKKFGANRKTWHGPMVNAFNCHILAKTVVSKVCVFQGICIFQTSLPTKVDTCPMWPLIFTVQTAALLAASAPFQVLSSQYDQYLPYWIGRWRSDPSL